MTADHEERSRYLVVLEEAAVIDLLAPAIEAACVPPVGSKKAQEEAENLEYEGLEVGGALWGGISKDRWSGRYVTNVRRATVSKQSRGTASSFSNSNAALNVKRQLFEALWPQLSLIGRFHTHPYMTTSRTQVSAQDLHHPSTADIRAFQDSKETRIELIVTVSKKQSKNDVLPGWIGFPETRGKLDPSCVLFGIADIAVWIRACVWEHDADGNFAMIKPHEVHLHCPAVTGLMLPTDEGLESFRRIGAGRLVRQDADDE